MRKAKTLWPAALSLAAILLGAVGVRAQEPLITEFMASNSNAFQDEDGDYSDWVEIYNPADAPVSLDGWHLTDSAKKLTKWTFPDVSIPPKGYLVVFCSNKDRRDPDGVLHTSFALSAGGEYLGLVKPDGVTVVSQYAPEFPPQQANISYGMFYDGENVTFIAPGASVRALVPADNSLGLSWTQNAFNDAAWTTGITGVGFERGSGFESLIGLDLNRAMYRKNATAYIRIPFQVDVPANVSYLNLNMKYDDGFVAYINGQRVASANAPATLTYNSSATQFHDDPDALRYVPFNVSGAPLSGGTNVLAIHGLNAESASSDFLILPQLVGYAGQGPLPDQIGFLPYPTPGAPNVAASSLGPDITEVTHQPASPAAGEPLMVTARIGTLGAAPASVSLDYRVMFGPVSTITMFDDGLHGDGAAGDGVYGAAIPSGSYSAGQMVRYKIRASDTANRDSRLPLFTDPSSQPEYYGTIVRDPSIDTQLPVLHWFVENPSAAETDAGTRSSVYYQGEFYDNIFTRLRGNTSRSWPKKNFKFDFNTGFHFRYNPEEDRVEEFNLQSTYSDKSYMRQVLSWEAYEQAGVAGSRSFHMHVRQNNAFYSVAEWVEQPDKRMLDRLGLSPVGALYKMENQLTDAWGGVEKKTRKDEDNSDLQSLVNGIQLSGGPLHNYLFDNVNIPAVINYIAATTVIHDNDHVAKNYYLYRDTTGTGEWMFLPWDKDLTFGRNFTLGGGVLNDTIWASTDPYSHPLFGDRFHQKVDNLWNRLIDAIYRDPAALAMYLQRLRTVMTDLLQPPGTPVDQLKFERRIDELVALIAADAERDRLKWPTYGTPQTLSTAVAIMKGQYLGPRRNHLFLAHGSPGGLIPPAPIGLPDVRFGTMDRQPASGNKNEQYVQVVNNTSSAVDVSGWTIQGDITFTFKPGTVILPQGSVYVARDVPSFRSRAVKPNGGQGLLVQGNFKKSLSADESPMILRSGTGALVTAVGYGIGEALDALHIAAGLQSVDPDRVGLLDVADTDGSAGQLDLADAIRLLQIVAGE